MKTLVFGPKNAAIKGLIESYIAVESSVPIDLRTIPNGRVDASIVLEGKLEWLFTKSNKFEPLSQATFYPPTRTGGRVRSRGPTYCIGIKFYPHILALPAFENKKLKEPIDFDEFFKTPSLDKYLIKDLRRSNSLDYQAQSLDTYFFKQFFSQTTSCHWIQEVIGALESGSSAHVKIGKVAEDMGVSVRTLERKFQKIIGLTPKLFSSIIQLHQATKNIRKKASIVSHGDLTEALANGYYDQSHFIKSCRRITGLSPKKLFTHLPSQVTDLVILK